jgi:class 3 adenylate cyclase
MESKPATYDFAASLIRMDEILNESDNSFPEKDTIPKRDSLTFRNGFYVNCAALFVDIRGSSDLPKTHNRPILAKLYRVFISEMIAVLNGNSNCAETNVVGDSVSGIFNAPYTSDIDRVFSTAAEAASVVDLMNFKFRKRGISEIKIGIGLDYGRALMIKAGYNGSGMNDVVWMGDVVNSACHLSNKAGKSSSGAYSYGYNSYNYRIMVSNVIYNNLNEHNQKLLTKNSQENCYHGSVVNSEIDAWLKQAK